MHREPAHRGPTAGRMLNGAAVALCLGLAGCGGTALPFEPIHPSGMVGATYPTTAYELKVGSFVLGDAVVWSEGGTEAPTGERQVLDVEMEIHNTTRGPIHLDVARTTVNVTTRDGYNAPLTVPLHVAGSRDILPESSTRVGLRYELPNGVTASDVKRFDFNWRVASLSGDYAQSTPFVPTPPPASDGLNDRGLPCSGVYRISNIQECVNPPPTVSFPIR